MCHEGLRVARATIDLWLSILDSGNVIFRLQPYHANVRKWLAKTPKVYFRDTGLPCHLLVGCRCNCNTGRRACTICSGCNITPRVCVSPKTGKQMIMDKREELFDKLDDGLKERVKAANTPEELLTLLGEAGFELSDEELDGIAGGGWDCFPDCPTFMNYCRREDDAF